MQPCTHTSSISSAWRSASSGHIAARTRLVIVDAVDLMGNTGADEMVGQQ